MSYDDEYESAKRKYYDINSDLCPEVSIEYTDRHVNLDPCTIFSASPPKTTIILPHIIFDVQKVASCMADCVCTNATSLPELSLILPHRQCAIYRQTCKDRGSLSNP
jgi:hypothetical protein